MSVTLHLTDEEAKILDNYIFRKCCKLKDAALEDSACYIALSSIRNKITISKRRQQQHHEQIY